MIKSLCVALCVSILISGCSSEKENIKTRTALCKELYANAKVLFDEEEYYELQEDVNELLNTCTGTGVMEESQYLLAESHFRSENWLESRSEFSIFASHYPNSPKAIDAIYKKGLSSFNMEFVPGRDGAHTKNSISDFNDFVTQYPKDSLVDSARFYISELNERMASADMATAELYLTMGKPLATAIYLKDFLIEHPQSKRINTALIMLVECYTRIEQFNQALQFIEMLKERTLTEEESARYNESVDVYNDAYKNLSTTIKEEKKMKTKEKVEF